MICQSSFLAEDQLCSLGLHSFGKNVKISGKVSIYDAGRIDIGNNVRIDDFCILCGGVGISIGNFVHIGAYSSLFGGTGIRLEDFSNLSTRVALFSESDDISGSSLVGPIVPVRFKPRYRAAPILLQRHAAVATGSTVFPGVIMEEGALLAAHSSAIKRCKRWTIYSGNPAARLRDRKRDLLLLEKQFLYEYL